jgi:Gas vesicle synthesis protein GvpL/GvpF
VLPMKLFTIFSDDERAVESIRRDEPRISRLLKRVAGHHEWGVRVALAPVAQPAGRPATRRSGAGSVGAGYLAQKKARRDAAAELVLRSRGTAANVFDEAARLASDARRRSVAEPGGDRGPLLLDAVFLVPARAAARFQKTIERRARALAPAGYHVVLTGPWPPYGFIQD